MTKYLPTEFAFVLLWMLIGVAGSGFAYAAAVCEFQHTSPRKHAVFMVAWGAFGGPIAAAVSIAVTGAGEDGWWTRGECSGSAQ